MSIIIFNPLKACSNFRWEDNMNYLVDCYLWVTTGVSLKGLNYTLMLRDPVPKRVSNGRKAGWKKGVKRMYRGGKAIKEVSENGHN